MIGDDLVYLIGGGENSHVGAISVCEPGKKSKNLKFGGHKDYVITEMIAKAACEKYNKKTSCIGGVHIDKATKNEINKLVENCRGLIKWI